MFPNHPLFPKRYTHKGFSVFFSEPPYFPGTVVVIKTGCWSQNSFGVTILIKTMIFMKIQGRVHGMMTHW